MALAEETFIHDCSVLHVIHRRESEDIWSQSIVLLILHKKANCTCQGYNSVYVGPWNLWLLIKDQSFCNQSEWNVVDSWGSVDSVLPIVWKSGVSRFVVVHVSNVDIQDRGLFPDVTSLEVYVFVWTKRWPSTHFAYLVWASKSIQNWNKILDEII